jgi:hypothetical protein
MITPDEQIKLKSILGANYTDEVLELLNNKGVRNRNGHPHNPIYVSMILNGHRHNIDVEAALWTVANAKMKEANKVERLKREILK